MSSIVALALYLFLFFSLAYERLRKPFTSRNIVSPDRISSLKRTYNTSTLDSVRLIISSSSRSLRPLRAEVSKRRRCRRRCYDNDDTGSAIADRSIDRVNYTTKKLCARNRIVGRRAEGIVHNNTAVLYNTVPRIPRRNIMYRQIGTWDIVTHYYAYSQLSYVQLCVEVIYDE